MAQAVLLGSFAWQFCLRSDFPMPEYRRRLPHFHPADCCLFLTWRLWGSLPIRTPSRGYRTPGHAFAASNRVADRLTSGPLLLQDHRIERRHILTETQCTPGWFVSGRAMALVQRRMAGNTAWQHCLPHPVRTWVSKVLRSLTKYRNSSVVNRKQSPSPPLLT